MATLSDRIIQARKAKNWTQKDLASALNLNTKNISRWELGQTTPSIEVAAELAKVLGVSLDFLGGMASNGKADPLTLLFNQKVSSLSSDQKAALNTVLIAF